MKKRGRRKAASPPHPNDPVSLWVFLIFKQNSRGIIFDNLPAVFLPMLNSCMSRGGARF